MKLSSVFRSLLPLARTGALVADLSLAASAQVALQWTATQDLSQLGSGDSPYTMTVDAATNRLYVTGWFQISPGSFGQFEAFVSAYDFAGTPLWTCVIPPVGGRTTTLYRVAVHPSGGVVAVGTGFTPFLSDSDTLVARIDATGNLLWSTHWDGPSASLDDGDDVYVDAAGVAHVVTRTWSNALNDYQSALLDYDANGSLLAATITSAPSEIATNGRIARLAGGDYIVSAPPRTTRFTSAGVVVWSSSIASGGFEPTSIAADGSVYFGGTGAPIAPANIGPFQVTRVDPNGALAWVRTITDPVFVGGGANSIAVTASGTVVAVGFRSTDICDPNGFATEGLVACYDAAGNLLWQRTTTFDGVPIQEFWRAEPTSNGDVLLVGISSDLFSFPTLRILRVSPDGEVRLLVTGSTPLIGGQLVGQVGAGPADEMFLMTANSTSSFGQADLQLSRFDATLATYCLGDGTSSVCPCGNAAPLGSLGGCVNGVGTVGRLVAHGDPSLSADTMRLDASGLSNANVLFFQGTSAIAGGVGVIFGDGLRCAGGTTTRLGVKTASGGASQYPAANDAVISVRGSVSAAGTRTYQAWYRSSENFCTPATFNLTNAVRATWTP